MTRKKSSKTKEDYKPRAESRTSLMFPSLHQAVVNAVFDKIASTPFHKDNSNKGCNNEYETCIMGKFKCVNDSCSATGWGSKKVAIVIRGYPGNAYNAEVFNQRCKSCGQLGTPSLDNNSYVDRVTYRLKKWAGVPTEKPYYKERKGPPHRPELCEGCKRGVCQRRDDRNDY